ncbi:class I SAM-dependent methyltransferase [Nocardiopsis sp. CT-R113]|uniref:Class I SAM-dependent methyltransferase n=1 Tax=Nocardiopsis codii TaxID=3065942 RepID=A0ABU7KCK5_9ACTN|nr:class I SAM-dependent methyltransferase [Nocardiopsis sp. CT-R113]MEE2039961.1 class I SAM-dependent methyltransferase [Nocardiopsis sp. CT-R113]
MSDKRTGRNEKADYGDGIADVFDTWYGEESDSDCLSALRKLADGGPVLELGVGTGRVAVPLAASGLEVTGVESSREMIDQLSGKPGAERVSVIEGDLADVPVDGDYSLVTCVDNTLFLLESQAEQVRCFTNVARRLRPGGVFVVEVPARVPRMDEDEQQGVFVEHVGAERVGLWVVEHDRAAQRMFMQQISFENGSVRLLPVPVRYAWPAELDLMAQIAGLRLRHRWSGWDGAAFTSQSVHNVSVYERIEDAVDLP